VNLTLDEALELENEYFKKHSVYKSMENYCGIKKIIEKLSKLFLENIKNKVPEILNAVNEKDKALKSQIAKLGKGIPEDNLEKKELLNNLVFDFSRLFEAFVRGRQNEFTNEKIECGGFEIVEKFEHFLLKESNENYRITEIFFKDEDIIEKIKILYGDTFLGSFSTHSFNYLIMILIEKLIL